MAGHINFDEPAEEVRVFFDPKHMYERLYELCIRSGYGVFQKNGQRYYGPPPHWKGEPPEKGSEIFIGRLPRDCFEDELVPVLESVAPLYEARLMLNFTGSNRGFAFITYCNAKDACRAVTLLHNYELRPGHKIVASKSINNCRLYVGGIPFKKTKADAWEEIVKIFPTVKDIIMYSHPDDKTKNRGFFFVEFDTHRSAAMAKRSVVTNKLWQKEVLIDWAAPEPDVDPDIMATVTKLFIRNLTQAFTPDTIRHILVDTVPLTSIERIHLAKHYGFVHFDTRTNAQLAMDKLAMVIADGEFLEVQWARPRRFKTRFSCCKSLPPRFRRKKNSTSQDNQELVLVSDDAELEVEDNNNYLSPSVVNIQQLPKEFQGYNHYVIMDSENPCQYSYY